MSANQNAAKEAVQNTLRDLEAMRKSIDAGHAPQDMAARREDIDFQIKRFGGDGWEVAKITNADLNEVKNDLTDVSSTEVQGLLNRVSEVDRALPSGKNEIKEINTIIEDVAFDEGELRYYLETKESMPRAEFEAMRERYHGNAIVNQVTQLQEQHVQNQQAATIYKKASDLHLEHDAGSEERQDKFDTVFGQDTDKARQLMATLKTGPLSATQKVELAALAKKYEGTTEQIVKRVTAEIEPTRPRHANAGRAPPTTPTAKSDRMPPSKFNSEWKRGAAHQQAAPTVGQQNPKSQAAVSSPEASPRTGKG